MEIISTGDKMKNGTYVCNVIRAILRDQVTSSWMDSETVKFVFENRLINHSQWPGWCMTLTEAGEEYLKEHSLSQ